MIYSLGEKKTLLNETSYISEGTHLVGDIAVNDNVSIWFGAVLRADNDRIRIGKNSNIQDNCTVHTDYGFPVIIGERVTVGHNVVLHGCNISDDVIIGMGSIVLDGSNIPSNVIVGAGSIITSKSIIEEGTLVLGSPAKSVRKLKDEDYKLIENSYKHYVEKISIYKKELKNER